MLISLFSLALADVVEPPTVRCPSGAFATASHGGDYCVPNEADPETCPADSSAREVGLCVLEQVLPCPGNSAEDCTYTRREALRTCQSDADCNEADTTCEIAPRCVEATLCGCDQAGWAGGVFGLALVPLLFRRRRS